MIFLEYRFLNLNFKLLMELGDGKIAGKYALGPKIGSGSFG